MEKVIEDVNVFVCVENKRGNKNDYPTWSFFCPKCKMKITHGAGQGYRAGHCSCWDSYYIKLAK